MTLERISVKVRKSPKKFLKNFSAQFGFRKILKIIKHKSVYMTMVHFYSCIVGIEDRRTKSAS